ncbi:MAG: outer membrane protein assembly factor BamC [Zoogloeaceae bacterium]|jgi:outer membrane protein assembly factor BamC|nr:outer membrane protein assembly factor BamC [Zoogloeaceae bacterium]
MSRKSSAPFFLLAAAMTLTALAGCSTLSIESKKIDYKSAGKLPPLEVPPDLTAPNRDERYAVPDISPRGSATYSAYNSERSGTQDTAAQTVLPQVEKMRIERSGSQRWLVVTGEPDQLWPTLKEFWQDLGFIVNVELPEAGIMETDWAENRAKLPQDVVRATLGKVLDAIYSTPERDKFRTRLEKGADGTTEIYISHRGMYEVYANEGQDRTVWQPRPPDPELEAEMLRRLMVRLGTEDSQAKAMLAGETKTEERAKLLKNTSGAGTLQLQEAFDRSWRRVGLALDRVGFTVEDRERTKGLYYVRYVDPEASAKKSEGGFLSKLKFWESSKPADNNQQFRILVQGTGDEASTVQVLTREGGIDNSETAKKILGLLYDQLK